MPGRQSCCHNASPTSVFHLCPGNRYCGSCCWADGKTLENCWSVTDWMGDWSVAGFKFVNLCVFSRYRSYRPTWDAGRHTTKEVVTGKKMTRADSGSVNLLWWENASFCYWSLLFREKKPQLELSKAWAWKIIYFNQKVFHRTLQSYSCDVWFLIFTWDSMTPTGALAAQGAARLLCAMGYSVQLGSSLQGCRWKRNMSYLKYNFYKVFQ